MSTKLKAGTSTAGAVLDADTTGILELQSGSTPTTAITVDASQNVGIGTSSPATKLHVSGSTASSNELISRLSSFTTTSHRLDIRVLPSSYSYAGLSGASVGLYSATVPMTFQADDSQPFIWATGGAERMRISSNGNVGIGVTNPGKKLSVVGPSNVDLSYFESTSGTGWSVGPVASAGRFNWYQENAAADRMFLSTAGALFNATGTYGTISDVSLKENIVDATPKLADLMQVKVRNFNLKADPDKRKVIGVVAQELEEVFPGLIEEIANRTVQKDGSFLEQNVKAVKYSVLTTILIKAVQEQQLMIEELKTKVAALEAK